MSTKCESIIGQLIAATRVIEWIEACANHESNHVITGTDEELVWCSEVEEAMDRQKKVIYELIQRGHKC